MTRQTATHTRQQKPSGTPAASELLQRKCACGSHTMGGGECQECGKKKRLGLQTKLKINDPGDIYEQEADRIADQVTVVPTHYAVSSTLPHIQRLSGHPTGQTTDAAPASVDQTLTGSGRPLDSALRQDMEQRFGYDFSPVRVHTNAAAGQSTQDVNAHAYTVGHNIVFAAGRFAPWTHEGQRLIAHELTHVVQQSGSDGISSGQRNTQSGPSSISYHTHGLETNSSTFLQHDLALEPTNPHPQEINLTAGQIRDAINFNRRRYDAENTRLIQDVVGAPQTGIFDEETIRLIARYQDDFGLTPVDGKVGPDTFDQLTAELQAENVNDQTCLTMFNVSDPTIPLDIRVAGPGLADIFSRFNVRARFSPHCNCNEFDYRQFICGTVDRTQGGVATNINNLFTIPGGGLPQCPGWVEDGNTTQPQNGRYGHRNHPARVNNRYLDDAGTVDMANGCRFEAFDVPGMFGVPANPGDRYDFDIRFFGDVRRNGRRMQRKFWAVRDNLTIP